MGIFPFFSLDTQRLWLESHCLWNRLAIPWHNAVWAQKVQFQDLIFSLRTSPIHGPLDPRRLKTVADFQRLSPLGAGATSPIPSCTNVAPRPSTPPAARSLQNELLGRLLDGYRIASQSQMGVSSSLAARGGILLLDILPPVDLQIHEPTGPWVEILPNPRIRLELASQLISRITKDSQIPNWKSFFEKKDFRGLIGTKGLLHAWGKALGFDDESWPWQQFRRIEMVVTDSPGPANKPTSLAWMEVKTVLGNAWAHLFRHSGLVQGWPRVGLFWEFIEPGSPLSRGNLQRYWLGNVPLNTAFELVVSSTKGLLTQRTGVCLLLKDRNQAIFQIAPGFNISTNSSIREVQTNPHAPHPPMSGREEGWQGTSSRTPW